MTIERIKKMFISQGFDVFETHVTPDSIYGISESYKILSISFEGEAVGTFTLNSGNGDLIDLNKYKLK